MRSAKRSLSRTGHVPAKPVQLLAAYPNLFRQPFGGHDLSQSVGFFRNLGRHLGRIVLARPFQSTRGRFLAMPAQHRQRRTSQETFGAASSSADAVVAWCDQHGIARGKTLTTPDFILAMRRSRGFASTAAN